MASGATFDYFFFLTQSSIALRNNVQPRRWGMEVNVINDGTYELVYNSVTTDINDNANWVKIAGPSGIPYSWSRVAVPVAPANLAMNMGSKQQVDFIPSGNITAPKTWVISNETEAYQFNMRFTLTGLDAQTMPVNFQMADPLWNPATNVWTPIDIGTYEALATFDGTNWFLKIIGLFE